MKNVPCFLPKHNNTLLVVAHAAHYSCVVNKYYSFNDFNQTLVTFLQAQAQDAAADFAPQVTATCKAGAMNIKILFNSPYGGAVHARDFRNPYCMTSGNGSNIVTMSLNLLAKQGSAEYCGILVSNVGVDVRVTNFAY